MAVMSDDDKFLSRWAKLKAESRAGTLVEEPGVPEAPEVSEVSEEVQVAGLSDAEADVEELPEDHPAVGIDIETLNADSDFSVFMHEKVPQAIRRQALRRLWSSDPIYANLDGLNDYDEDFTDAATVVEGLKAAYDEAVVRRDKLEAEEAAKAEAEARRVAEADGEDEPEEEETSDGEEADAVGEADPGPDDGVLAEVEDDDLEDDDLENGTDEA